MRKCLAVFALVAVWGLPVAARADVLDVYQLHTVMPDGYTLGGTVTLDLNTQTFYPDFVDTFPGGSETFSMLTYNAGIQEVVLGSLGDSLTLLVDTGFNPGTYFIVCSTDHPCAQYLSYILTSDSEVFVTSGTLTLEGVTPEPSSLVLLGTGVLGVARMVRRRARLKG